MQSVDLQKIDSFIREVALAEIMPRFRNMRAHEIEIKPDKSSVTVADKAAERALIERLTQYLPGSVVVGEEGYAADPKILSHLGGDRDVWVIDPIDGTSNYLKGSTEFGTMVALVRQRKTIAAWIHDPNSGDTLMAEQGGGVWLRGHKMRLAARDLTIPTVGIIGSRLRKVLTNPAIVPLLQSLPVFETGSATAFDYGRLFTGDALFGNSTATRAAFLFYRRAKVWDHVPGLFLSAEAGGYAADLQGAPYDMEMGKTGLLVAADRPAWDRLQTAFNPAINALLGP